jgi:methionyl aminopeptidase
VPAPLNYGGFPKSICTSINDVVCHGIPSPREVLRQGDIINLDVTTILDGYYGDVSQSLPVGRVSPEAKLLLERTKTALNKAIKSLKPGKYLNQCVGKVIQPYIESFGYSVVRELGGHGVGLQFHEDPFVFHFDTNRQDVLLQPGMIFTIEPMVNASKNWKVVQDRHDGWTIRTTDGALSAQFEHTILITPSGSEILTILSTLN